MFSQPPYIAILRGLEPQNAIDVVTILYEEGFKIVEVPLNSPQPILSIQKIKKHFDDKIVVGAGTVLTMQHVDEVADAGGEIILSPNCNANIIKRTKERGLYSFPGVMTPSEAFSALEAGADGLKIFPCELIQPPIVKAYKAVLPKDIVSIAVGGIGEHNIKDFLKVGISGFGFGSSLFTPQMTFKDIRSSAQKIMKALA